MALTLKHLHTPHSIADLLPLPLAVVSDYREELEPRRTGMTDRKATITAAGLIAQRVDYAQRVASATRNLERLDAVIEAMVAGAYLDEPVDEPGPEQAELDLEPNLTSTEFRGAYTRLEKYITDKDRVSAMTVALQTKAQVRAAKLLAKKYAHVQFDEESVMIVGRLELPDD